MDPTASGTSRSRQRADRIREEIEIVQVLSDLGYAVHAGGGDREQQFSCDLHGDGRDTKPSARVYPQSQSWYCFACDKTRDAIGTIRERMDLSFSQACAWLEKEYGLPPLPWTDDDEEAARAAEAHRNVGAKVQAILNPGTTFEEDAATVRGRLLRRTLERDIPLSVMMTCWEAFDLVCWMVAEEQWTKDKGRERLEQIRQRVLREPLVPRGTL